MAIKPGLYGIDGNFGSGKTLTAVRWITQLYKVPTNIIFTNIKLTFDSPNIYFFNETIDDYDARGNYDPKFGLADVLEYIGKIDGLQRELHVSRRQRLNFFIFHDEVGIIFNQHTWKKFPLDMLTYLLQVRKINVYLFLIAQKYKNIATQIREHIEGVFYFRPLWGLDRFDNLVGEIRLKQVDIEGNTECYVYASKDEQGHVVKYEEPIDRHCEYIIKPYYFDKYDDLYLNKKFLKPTLFFDYQRLSNHIQSTLTKVTNSFTRKKLDVITVDVTAD